MGGLFVAVCSLRWTYKTLQKTYRGEAIQMLPLWQVLFKVRSLVASHEAALNWLPSNFTENNFWMEVTTMAIVFGSLNTVHNSVAHWPASEKNAAISSLQSFLILVILLSPKWSTVVRAKFVNTGKIGAAKCDGTCISNWTWPCWHCSSYLIIRAVLALRRKNRSMSSSGMECH